MVALEIRMSDLGVPVQGVQDKLRIYGRICDEGCAKDTAYLLMHPNANYMHHYLTGPMQKRGRAVMGLNTRYIGNDSMLLMERVIQDLGAGVQFLREAGYKRVIYIGNSGGGAIGTLYQAQAENLTISHAPDGTPIDLTPDDLPPVDALAMSCVHLGRHQTFLNGLDPAVIDENDMLASDPALDMFNPDNGPPYDKEWLKRYRAAQEARHWRITDWVRGRLRELTHLPPEHSARDQPFLIHRTAAKPEMLDPTLEPNDRPPGVSIWGGARDSNYAPTILGRMTTLRSFLSQWSPLSIADGPARLAETTVPVLNIEYSADESTYPSHVNKYSEAAEGRCEYFLLKDARHYIFKQPEAERLIGELADAIIAWGDRQ